MASTKKPTRKKSIIIVLVIIVVLLIVLAGTFFVAKDQNLGGVFGSNESSEVEDAQEIVVRVGKLIKLPDETPEVATVSDVTLLQDQSIFKNAQDGDKVLIFSDARKAIVFRPSENIIIEVGNLVVAGEGTDTEASEEEPQEEEEVKVVGITVFNATGTAGLAGRVGEDLESEFSNIEIVSTGNAAGDYSNIIVIDVSGENTDLVESIASTLDGEVDELPEDETAPNSDILVILGE